MLKTVCWGFGAMIGVTAAAFLALLELGPLVGLVGLAAGLWSGHSLAKRWTDADLVDDEDVAHPELVDRWGMYTPQATGSF